MAIRRKLSSRLVRIFWSCAAFFAVGYFVTVLANARAALVLAAAGAILFGTKAPSVRRAALRGAGLGLIAGLAMYGAMTTAWVAPLPDALLAADVAIMCGAQLAAGNSADSIGALGACAALARPYGLRPPGYVPAVYVASAVAMCALSAAAFAALAERRRERIERQWREGR